MTLGGTKFNAYRQYLRVKAVLDLFEGDKEVFKKDMADALGVDNEKANHMCNLLLKEKAIKLVRYDITGGHRLGVYKRILHD